MENYILPLLGGILIGLSASLLLLVNGRILGVTGIIANSFPIKKNGYWRFAIILGIVFGGFLFNKIFPTLFMYELENTYSLLIIAGLLVGFGTRLDSGCTSGHGVCGIPRFSKRSIIATLSFIIAGVATVYLRGM